MSEGQTEKMEAAVRAGIDPMDYYRAFVAQRGIVGDKGSDGKTITLSADKKKMAAVDEAVPDMSYIMREKLYGYLGISRSVW